MSGFAAERLAIEDAFRAGWDLGTYPVAFPNVGFTHDDNTVKPYPPIPASGELAAWARLNVLASPFGGDFASLGPTGSRLARTTSLIVVQCFAPPGVGVGVGLVMADIAGSIFEGKRFGSIVCGIATAEEIGHEGTYHQTNVNIPFTRDQLV